MPACSFFGPVMKANPWLVELAAAWLSRETGGCRGGPAAAPKCSAVQEDCLYGQGTAPMTSTEGLSSGPSWSLLQEARANELRVGSLHAPSDEVLALNLIVVGDTKPPFAQATVRGWEGGPSRGAADQPRVQKGLTSEAERNAVCKLLGKEFLRVEVYGQLQAR